MEKPFHNDKLIEKGTLWGYQYLENVFINIKNRSIFNQNLLSYIERSCQYERHVQIEGMIKIVMIDRSNKRKCLIDISRVIRIRTKEMHT
jgi:hypothetical protein